VGMQHRGRGVRLLLLNMVQDAQRSGGMLRSRMCRAVLTGGN
jgi:hypothetical protein